MKRRMTWAEACSGVCGRSPAEWRELFWAVAVLALAAGAWLLVLWVLP